MGSIGSNKWICLLIIGCALTVGVIEAAAETTKLTAKDATKDKRQIDRQGVVTIGGSASNSPPRFYNSHAGPVQQEAQDTPTYVTPRNGKSAHYRGPPPPPQPQQQELPEEYLKLLQQLSIQQAQQQFAQAPVRQPERAPNAKPRRIQAQRPVEQQYFNAQPSLQAEPGVQYITEEEYQRLLENQKQYEAAQQSQHVNFPNHIPGPIAPQQEGLGSFRLPQGKIPAAFSKYSQAQHLSRPLTDFDKELALLVESNKPVVHQGQPLPRPSSLKQSQVVQIPQRHNEPIYAPQHLPPPQNIRYAAPANIQYTPQKQTQQQSQKPPRFESPAHRYQLLSYAPQQQQAQSQVPQQPIRPDFADPQIQFYFPKEKDIQTQHQPQYQEVPQHLLYETQGVMKVVDPPQLQYQPQEPQQHRPSSKYQSAKKPQQAALQSSQSVQQETQRPSNTPTRSQIYVSRTTQGPPIPNQPQPAQPTPSSQQQEKPKLPPLKIDPNRPLTQEEFQKLVDQGYNVVPVPVPVPYPVHINVPETEQDRKQSQQPEDPQPSQSQRQYFSQSSRPRHHSPAYRYGQQTASGSRNVPTYLQPVLSQDGSYAGIRGPSSVKN
ncbi:uncharacterized protein LOC134837783 [Culicoides brevitarsis]|uniref:uncharacterized protein LOC134837783 n=1 Tax=Culicoides brevitarsis TaxID=469753 RepID=UPI00307C1E1F